jgi:hypothetical protein
MELDAVRGKERQIAGYLAQRGWCYPDVQSVARKWEPVLGFGAVKEVFLILRRWYEEGTGNVLKIHGPQHLNFVREMASALEKLHAPENCAGWVIKMCGRVRPGTPIGRSLMSYGQMAKEIQAKGGPQFSVDALKKAAQRLKVARYYDEAEQSFQSR